MRIDAAQRRDKRLQGFVQPAMNVVDMITTAASETILQETRKMSEVSTERIILRSVMQETLARQCVTAALIGAHAREEAEIAPDELHDMAERFRALLDTACDALRRQGDQDDQRNIDQE